MNAPPNAWQLERVIGLAMATIEALRTEHGQVIETDSEILDALAFEGVDAEEVLRRLVRAALDSKALAAAAESRMDDLKARRDRYRNHEAAYRDTILNVMEALGLRKFSDCEAGVSLSPGRPRVVVDDSKISDEFVHVTVVRTPDKARIKEALDGGLTVDGAFLSNAPPVLTIRVR